MMAILCISHLLLAQYSHLILSIDQKAVSMRSNPAKPSSNDEEQDTENKSKRRGVGSFPIGLQPQTSTLSWENVNFTLPPTKGKMPRQILQNIDGYVKPGTLTALMGATGAGKTTLLDALASRTTTGIVTGDVFVDGKLRTVEFRRKTGYSQQDDIHLATTTVKEALQFSARLRQPQEVPTEEKIEYVEEVIHVLGLEDCANSLVGVHGSGEKTFSLVFISADVWQV